MRPSVGIALKLGSVLAFVAMASLIKAASAEVPPWQAVFFRSAFALPVLLVWLAWRGAVAEGLRTSRPLAHVGRGLLGTAGMACGFAALGMLPLPEVTALMYAQPLLLVIFASAFLGERVGWVRSTTVGLGLVGVMLVLSPRLTGVGSDAQAIGAALAVTGAAAAALAHTAVRALVQTETTTAIVFWFSITASVLALGTIPLGWVWPSPTAVALLVGAGLVGGLGQIMMTSAYRYADASLVAPFEYTSMLLALVIGYVVFSEVPTGVMLAGAAIIIAAGILIIWRERQLGLARTEPRSLPK